MRRRKQVDAECDYDCQMNNLRKRKLSSEERQRQLSESLKDGQVGSLVQRELSESLQDGQVGSLVDYKKKQSLKK